MKQERERRKALVYHSKPRPGKIKVEPTKNYQTQRDLSLAYSPGVAHPCLEINKNPEDVYKYTSKSNLVAVISNGTAVLGLGDIGPLASKPVMEGKGLLFKIFADIDVFDIEIDTKNIDEFISTVKNIAPTFGGINLEDIKAPEAFEIERRLVEELNIPVMHDDQHGTAIISGAALINALDLAKKDIEKIKMVICGAGAAAISCAKMYVSLGVKMKNIIMFDSKGPINSKREDLSDEKKLFISKKVNIKSLDDALKNSDVFIGLSKADMLSTEMLKSMSENPIVFAMANPEPEINYKLAKRTRDDIILATGRSDHPNQVNNVLGFPFIFRGALDVRASKINEKMKMAAVYALAELAKEPVPENVNVVYGETKLTFGKDYIIPKPFDPRLISKIPLKVAKAAIDSGVARLEIDNWERYERELESRLGNDNKIIRLLLAKAKSDPKKVVFVEADRLEVLKAAQIAFDEGIAIPTLIGRKKRIKKLMLEIDFDHDLEVIDLSQKKSISTIKRYAKNFFKQRKDKGMTLSQAETLMRRRDYFGSMMVKLGEADALISGFSRSYPDVIKPILKVIGKSKGVRKVAATNLMITSNGPLFLADTSININPTYNEIGYIAILASETAKMFGFDPVIALLSYSNFGSSNHPMAKKVERAVKFLKRCAPELVVDGPVQSDFALNRPMFSNKFNFSKLSGQKVNVMVFPNLDSANITYKVIKELDNAMSIGPIIMGMDKPVHILQLKPSVEEIVNITAIAVVDAQNRK
ncbi:MAG: NADP-dependent malic enzyme [Flavobacteriaceae bacterium]|nr:NADP-dependent malic enzyme [Flavobacteriaceae bacterium]